MSSIVNKEKITSLEDFLSTKSATEIAPYSREHIGRLAREGKVRAIQVAGKWLVSAKSLQDFYCQSKIEEEILSERLSQERLVDQNISDYILNTKKSSTIKFTPRQKIFVHLVSSSMVATIGFLVFLSAPLFEKVSNVALLYNFNQSVSANSVFSLEAVEVTTPIDVANGILLLPDDREVVSIDPALLFSDEVQVIEGNDGFRYVRIYDGEDFSDIPFIHLPATYQYYREVVNTENPDHVF